MFFFGKRNVCIVYLDFKPVCRKLWPYFTYFWNSRILYEEMLKNFNNLEPWVQNKKYFNASKLFVG